MGVRDLRRDVVDLGGGVGLGVSVVIAVGGSTNRTDVCGCQDLRTMV